MIQLLAERLDGLLGESTSTPSWVKKAAKQKNFTGPNGNEVIAYEWRWKWDQKFSKREDGLVDAKVSDWGNAGKCVTCGRGIVHVYWVKDLDGKILQYGGDHLHMALGYPRELNKSQRDRIKTKVTTADHQRKEQEYQAERYKKFVQTRAGKSIGDANKAFMLSKGKAKRPPVFLFNEKTKQVMRADDIALDRFFQYQKGWKQESPESIRSKTGV